MILISCIMQDGQVDWTLTQEIWGRQKKTQGLLLKFLPPQFALHRAWATYSVFQVILLKDRQLDRNFMNHYHLLIAFLLNKEQTLKTMTKEKQEGRRGRERCMGKFGARSFCCLDCWTQTNSYWELLDLAYFVVLSGVWPYTYTLGISTFEWKYNSCQRNHSL